MSLLPIEMLLGKILMAVLEQVIRWGGMYLSGQMNSVSMLIGRLSCDIAYACLYNDTVRDLDCLP